MKAQDRDHEASSVLDLVRLANLERDLGNRSAVREVVGIYLRLLPERQRAVTEAAEAGDVIRLQRAAHALSSSSALVGAAELRALCRDLESADRGADLRLLATACGASCDAARDGLTAWLADC